MLVAPLTTALMSSGRCGTPASDRRSTTPSAGWDRRSSTRSCSSRSPRPSTPRWPALSPASTSTIPPVREQVQPLSQPGRRSRLGGRRRRPPGEHGCVPPRDARLGGVVGGLAPPINGFAPPQPAGAPNRTGRGGRRFRARVSGADDGSRSEDPGHQARARSGTSRRRSANGARQSARGRARHRPAAGSRRRRGRRPPRSVISQETSGRSVVGFDQRRRPRQRESDQTPSFQVTDSSAQLDDQPVRRSRSRAPRGPAGDVDDPQARCTSPEGQPDGPARGRSRTIGSSGSQLPPTRGSLMRSMSSRNRHRSRYGGRIRRELLGDEHRRLRRAVVPAVADAVSRIAVGDAGRFVDDVEGRGGAVAPVLRVAQELVSQNALRCARRTRAARAATPRRPAAEEPSASSTSTNRIVPAGTCGGGRRSVARRSSPLAANVARP